MFGIPLHFLVVHFPIVLALLAILCDLRGLHDMGYRLNGWGAVAAALAVLTGLQMGGGRIESPEAVLHVGSALLGTLALVALGALRYSARARERDLDVYPRTWILVGILAGIAIATAAVTGHRFALGI
jgi:uncharacterized membrane protein